MSLKLKELQREFAAAPDNEELRSALIVGLMEAGHDSEASDLLKARFHCSIPWDKHSGREHSQTRHCETCNKTVHFVTTEEELAKKARRNGCMVAPGSLVQKYCESLSRDLREGLDDGSKGPHCLSITADADYKLLELDHYPQTIRNWSGSWPFLPMVLKSEKDIPSRSSTFVLAATLPPDKEVSDHLLTVVGYKTVVVTYIPDRDAERLHRERRELFA
ncbi:MAG: hypothetical protein P1V97_34470 [Planctomycetota bacterium]|nr:hypothetical protein [Planctomycetota bacterium]